MRRAATFSAVNLKPLRSGTRSTETGYFGRFGSMPVIRNLSRPVLNSAPKSSGLRPLWVPRTLSTAEKCDSGLGMSGSRIGRRVQIGHHRMLRYPGRSRRMKPQNRRRWSLSSELPAVRQESEDGRSSPNPRCFVHFRVRK